MIDKDRLKQILKSDLLHTRLAEAVAEEYNRSLEQDAPDPKPEDPPAPDPDPTPVPPVFPDPKTRFRVFEDINYKNRPNLLAEFGMEPVQLHYEKTFFDDKARPGDGNFILPPVSRIKKAAESADLVSIIDIERWWGGNGAAIPGKGIENYERVAKIYRDSLPENRKFGFYGTLPIRHYWAPVRGGSAKKEWQDSNSELTGIGELVDYTFPSIYTFYEDRKQWYTYAVAQVSEARRIAPDKPCYAFLWPEMHPGTGPIDPGYWRFQLETMKEHADGVVIWTLSKTKGIDFKDIPPWWRETVLFLQAGFS